MVRIQVRFNRVPEKVPEVGGRLWCRARLGSTGFRRRFRRRFQEALVQSQVRFNRFPEKVAEKIVEKVLGTFGAGRGQVQRVPEKVAEKIL